MPGSGLVLRAVCNIDRCIIQLPDLGMKRLVPDIEEERAIPVVAHVAHGAVRQHIGHIPLDLVYPSVFIYLGVD